MNIQQDRDFYVAYHRSRSDNTPFLSTESDNLIVGKENRIGAMKMDRRHLPVTYKTVDRSRDLRSCFSYSK